MKRTLNSGRQSNKLIPFISIFVPTTLLHSSNIENITRIKSIHLYLYHPQSLEVM